MLNNHPDFEIPPESHFIPQYFVSPRQPFSFPAFLEALGRHPRFEHWRLDPHDILQGAPEPEDPRTAIVALYSAYAAARGKTRFGDKTPGYALHVAGLARLFPEAVFVHLIRDGRDAALSLLEQPFGPDTIEDAAAYWTVRVTSARRDGLALGPGRYLEIRYEDLVRDPTAQLQATCDFAQLRFEPAMVAHQAKAADTVASTTLPEAHRNVSRPLAARRSWKDQMPTEAARRFEAVCGDVLKAFGY